MVLSIVYFIRHAQADSTVKDGMTRPLTEKGLNDRKLVTAYLKDKGISAVLSSPFKRAVDTLVDFAGQSSLAIERVDGFRERRSDSDWDRINDFWPLIKRQWADFTYMLSDGECLQEVMDRNIAALNAALIRYTGQSIAIGTHGTSLMTILHYYDSKYNFEDFMDIVHIQPFIVKMVFEGTTFLSAEKVDVFSFP